MYGYSPEVVRFSYQSALDYYAAMGIELSQADREQLAADTIDHFIGLGLIENKLRETGQDIITEEQAQSLRTHAQNLYESVWQGLYQELTASGEEVSEAQVSQWLEKQGYTVDAYYQEALASERYRRILALYCGDVTVTPAQILQYYLDVFVNPDRLRYENDILRSCRRATRRSIRRRGTAASSTFCWPIRRKSPRRWSRSMRAYSKRRRSRTRPTTHWQGLRRMALTSSPTRPPMMRPMRM